MGPGNALRALLEALKLFANHCQAKVEHWQGMLSVEHGIRLVFDLFPPGCAGVQTFLRGCDKLVPCAMPSVDNCRRNSVMIGYKSKIL